ncbi:flagellar hook-basal body complex protein [Jannaschia sp. LMIT008]|uniref:flagellar hook protein FlgE n=1 Tax=Jannaschia maritima TaxID=3032585 RepID=UPI002811FEFC|nr:flagellar hook-basal body complex protein [Jannaschia sp. LMIT008]
MTISSSLNAGVTGLNVNSTKLATISDNIANSSTYGYKRAVADFHSLVIDQSRGTYSAGGVRVTTGREVTQRGTLITTANPTDFAIGGRGFLPVTPISSVESLSGGGVPLRMTTTGSFKPDANGYLVTDSGQVLMGWPATQDGEIGAVARDTATDLEPVRVDANQYEGDATTRINLGVNLPASITAHDPAKATVIPNPNPGPNPVTPKEELGDPISMQLEYFGNLGETLNFDVAFEPYHAATATDTNTNKWLMTVVQKETNEVAGKFEIQFDDTTTQGGTIKTVTPVDTDPVTAGNQFKGAYDAQTGLITLQIAAPAAQVELDIGRPGVARGLSQLSDVFAPVSITKDGSPVGNLATIEADANGYLHAIYDTGFSRVIYQVPIIDVPNANGLAALPNQTYQVSGESGAFYLWDAGDGPVGDIVGFAREESATDVAGELTALIQTQRAYNSNAKVIQTVDEMLQETTNIKR